MENDPVLKKTQLPKAVLSVANKPNSFLLECSCNCRVFHIFRRVARKV